MVGSLVRAPLFALAVYAGLMALTWFGFRSVPVGFIPQQDKGYLVVNLQLPDGASLERSEEVTQRVDAIVRDTPGVQHTIAVPGYSVLTATNVSNVGGMFVILDPFEERVASGRSADVVLGDLRQQFRKVQEAIVVAFGAPPVDGLGSTGGFKLQVQDRADAGFEALQGAVENVIRAGEAQPGLVGLFSSFRATQPQLYVDVDRTKAKALGVALDDVFATLQVYLGSAYVNDFTRFGRNWQVNVQADAAFRIRPEDIGALKVRSARRQDGPAGDAGLGARHHRSRHREPLQHVPVRRGVRRDRTRRQLGARDRPHGGGRPARASDGHGLRVDRADAPADPRRQHRRVRVRLRRAPGVHGAGRAVRELVAAAAPSS